MGIGGGSLDTPADALLGVAAWVGEAGAVFGCGSLGGAAVPAGVLIGPCFCAGNVVGSPRAARDIKTDIATRQKLFFAGLNKMPPINLLLFSPFSVALCALCVGIFSA